MCNPREYAHACAPETRAIACMRTTIAPKSMLMIERRACARLVHYISGFSVLLGDPGRILLRTHNTKDGINKSRINLLRYAVKASSLIRSMFIRSLCKTPASALVRIDTRLSATTPPRQFNTCVLVNVLHATQHAAAASAAADSGAHCS